MLTLGTFGQVFGCLRGHRGGKSWSEAGKCCVLCRQRVSDFGNLVRGRLKPSRKHKKMSGPHICCGTRASSSLAARVLVSVVVLECERAPGEALV